MQLWNPSLQFIYSKLSVQKMEQTCGTYVHTAQLKNQSTFSWKWQQCHTDAGGWSNPLRWTGCLHKLSPFVSTNSSCGLEDSSFVGNTMLTLWLVRRSSASLEVDAGSKKILLGSMVELSLTLFPMAEAKQRLAATMIWE